MGKFKEIKVKPGRKELRVSLLYDFMKSADDAGELAGKIADRGEDIFRESVQKLVGGQGYELLDYDLNPATLKWVDNRARYSAKSVCSTYNEKLPGMIEDVEREWADAHGGSLKGLNQKTASKLLRMKEKEYFEWKNGQVANTEFGFFWNAATNEFIRKNGLTALVHVMPEHASDPKRDTEPVCAEFAGKWLMMDDPIVKALPVHVACVHFISPDELQVEGALPDKLWVGSADGKVALDELEQTNAD